MAKKIKKWYSNFLNERKLIKMFKYLGKSQLFSLFSSSFSSFEVLLSSGILLGLKLFGINLFSFLLENGFNQDGFVLELVTLGSKIESVIKSSIDLLWGSVLSQKSSQNSLSSDPEDFGRHSAFPGTSLFTRTGVSTESLGLQMLSSSGSGMDFLFSFHD